MGSQLEIHVSFREVDSEVEASDLGRFSDSINQRSSFANQARQASFVPPSSIETLF